MKKIYYILTLLLCVYVQSANAQMGVNSTGAVPNAAAMLDVRSSDKGFLMPRMTTTQRDAMPAIADGLMIYNTSIAEIQVYRGLAGWQTASRMAVPFKVNGSITGGALTDAIIQSINSGTGPAVSGQTLGTGVGAGLFQGATANGVYALSISGNGVFATSTTGHGVYSQNNSSTNAAGRFVNNNASGDGGKFEASNGIGVFGSASGTGIGVQGTSISGYGGFFQSDSFTALEASSLSSYAIVGSNTSATIPVAQFANLSGGTALELVASTAIKITGAIKVAGGSSAPAFKITTNTAIGGNTSANYLTIPNTTLANSSNDILIVTHNYSPNSTYLNKAYGVFWSPIISAWNIYLEDVTSMPNNVTFNVLVIKQ
jgi:hypothetical protein